ncbi:hypothetical protein F5Y15DRAFT_50465 [Xylariaceae sp. FL0016]|nr:hypothetical protein F5Y15DRAFT_50465 [Xylariaceae sp. FL0016]
MMACPHLEAVALSPPTGNHNVYREDCTQCFDSIDDPTGLDVCLQCFNGGCCGINAHAQLHHVLKSHPLALNIRRSRKQVVKDEPPAKMSKLAIAAETEADKYDFTTTVKCLECSQELDKSNPKLAPVVDGILHANTYSRKEEIKSWELDLTPCPHLDNLQQQESRVVDMSESAHCFKCDLTENLWLCLVCGNLGCGRSQFGGAKGHSHGLSHFQESNHPFAIQVGSITPDGTAEAFCYDCGDAKVDPNLVPHLAHWGIDVAGRVKTERSVTERQLDENIRWEFNMTTEDGDKLLPLFGPSLTGLKNLGNSCYLASILQCLFDLPAFQARYNIPEIDLPLVDDPAQDLETQLRKIADGLLSGRYSTPDPDVQKLDDSTGAHYQKGLAPSMFKHLVGKDHSEFRTMGQQDAFELWQHVVDLISKSRHPVPLTDPTDKFKFVQEQKLQCTNCKKVRYTTTEPDNLMINVPPEKLPSKEGQTESYKPVTLKQCLDNFTAPEFVAKKCESCGSEQTFSMRKMFKTFPTTLVVNTNKMLVEGASIRKVDVPIIVGDEPFLLDEYMSTGQLPSEELLPEDEEPSEPAFIPNQELLRSLMEISPSENRCIRALEATGNQDANAAMMWLLERSEDPSLDAPLVASKSAVNKGGPSAADMEQLQVLGATPNQARKALKECNGNLESAANWFFMNMDDPGEAEEESIQESGDKAPAGNGDLPAKFQLQSIVCHKGTSVHSGHYVAFVRKIVDTEVPKWVLFNDEKVVEASDIEEMKKTAYIYFFNRVI